MRVMMCATVINGYNGSNPSLFIMAVLSQAPGNYTLSVSNYVSESVPSQIECM